MPQVNTNDPRPPYVQIADDLRQRVRSGALRPGDRVAPNRELAAEYGVAPMTVHQAIRTLREEGVLVSSQGRGVFVSATPDVADAGGDDLATGTRQELRSLEIRVGQLEEAVGSKADAGEVAGVKSELAELRRQVAVLTSQMIDLYAKLGQPYPHEAAGGTGERRKTG